MSHVRQQIRDNIVTALTADVTSVASRVYPSRVYPLRDGNLPGLCVYTLTEQSEVMSFQPVVLRRMLNVAVDVYVTSTTVADDTLDTVAAEIEASIGSDRTLSGVASDAILVSTEIDMTGEGDTPVVMARLVFLVEYVTSASDAETAL